MEKRNMKSKKFNKYTDKDEGVNSTT